MIENDSIESSQQDLDVTESWKALIVCREVELCTESGYQGTYDERIHGSGIGRKKEESAQETTMRMETVQEPEEKTAIEQKIPSASETPPQTPRYTGTKAGSGAYTLRQSRCKQAIINAPAARIYRKPAAGGRKFPKVAFIGIGLLLLVLVYMMTKGGGDSDNETEAAATDL